jgi:hypothetical protein
LLTFRSEKFLSLERANLENMGAGGSATEE